MTDPHLDYAREMLATVGAVSDEFDDLHPDVLLGLQTASASALVSIAGSLNRLADREVRP